MTEHAPFITIVMPVRNEASYIQGTLLQLLDQDYPATCYEIIVADGMSDDGTREIVQGLANDYFQLRLLDNPTRLSSSGRNVGFRNGSGDYFIVVDGHCYIPDRQFLRNHATCFSRSGADCLGRPQPLDPPGIGTFQRSVFLARSSRLGHGGDSLIFGEYEGFSSPLSNGAAYARHVFDKVGYVDETFDAAEDVEFNYRVEQARLSCYASPSLAVKYYPRETLRGLFRQMLRYGKGRYRFVRKHPQALTFNQLMPAVFVLGIYAMPVSVALYLACGMTSMFALLLVAYLVYAALIIAQTVTSAFRNGIQAACRLPVIFFVIHFALGQGFLSEAFARWRQAAVLDCDQPRRLQT